MRRLLLYAGLIFMVLTISAAAFNIGPGRDIGAGHWGPVDTGTAYDVGDALLLEDGVSFLLLETGDKLLLE